MSLPHTGDAPNSVSMLKTEAIINTGIRGGLTVIKNPPFLLVAFTIFFVALLGILLF
jgi:hypothetical protein